MYIYIYIHTHIHTCVCIYIYMFDVLFIPVLFHPARIAGQARTATRALPRPAAGLAEIPGASLRLEAPRARCNASLAKLCLTTKNSMCCYFCVFTPFRYIRRPCCDIGYHRLVVSGASYAARRRRHKIRTSSSKSHVP